MHSIVDVCEETCQLGILDEGNVFYIQKVDSPQKIRMISHAWYNMCRGNSLDGSKSLNKVVMEMYKYSNRQISLSDFRQPVGMHLKEDNRWGKKAQTIFWS